MPAHRMSDPKQEKTERHREPTATRLPTAYRFASPARLEAPLSRPRRTRCLNELPATKEDTRGLVTLMISSN